MNLSPDFLLQTAISGGLGLVGFLAVHILNQVRADLKKLTADVALITTNQELQKQLNDFTNGRLNALEVENSTFRRAFRAMDRLLYAKGIDSDHLTKD